jgi:DNA polymerase III delta prime subunit
MLLEKTGFLADTKRNKSSLRVLTDSIKSAKVSHAYLFYGSDVEMLYELALAFAASINCNKGGCGGCRVCRNTLKGLHENLYIVEPEGNVITIEKVSDIQRSMSFVVNSEGFKISLIKETHLMKEDAASRFLKTLEDPPDEKSIFILLTDDLAVMLPTIVSRCMLFEWDFNESEIIKARLNYDELNKLVDAGIKSLITYCCDSAYALDLSVRILDFIKESLSRDAEMGKTQDNDIDAFITEQIRKLKNTKISTAELKKYSDAYKKKLKRITARFYNLGINIVFDIITAWLEDILATAGGCTQEVLNRSGNYDFLLQHFDSSLENQKVFDLYDSIDKNRKQLNSGIYQELALDSMFLKIQSLKSKAV